MCCFFISANVLMLNIFNTYPTSIETYSAIATLSLCFSESFRSISNTSSKALCGKRQDIFSAWTGFTNRFKIYPKPIETTWGVATLSPGFFERVRPTSNTLSTALCEKKQGIFSAWTGLTNRLLFFFVASFLPGWDSLSLDESRIFGLWIFSIVLSDSTCACVTLFCFLVRHHVLPILSY